MKQRDAKLLEECAKLSLELDLMEKFKTHRWSHSTRRMGAIWGKDLMDEGYILDLDK